MQLDVSSLTAGQVALIVALLAAATSLVSAVIAATAAFVTAWVNGRNAVRLDLLRAKRDYRVRNLEKAQHAIDERFALLRDAILSRDVSCLKPEMFVTRLAIPTALRSLDLDFWLKTLADEELRLVRMLEHREHVTDREIFGRVAAIWGYLSHVQREVERYIFLPPPGPIARFRLRRSFRAEQRLLEAKLERIMAGEALAPHERHPFFPRGFD